MSEDIMRTPIFLPNIISTNGAICFDKLGTNKKTTFISITGQDGSGKTNLRDNIAKSLANLGYIVITAKSPCDKHTVNLLNNAISQNGYEDWYTEQLLFSFMDGLLSNYMIQLNGKCDFFVCQRGPIDQYAHGVTRSGQSYSEIYSIQRPLRLAKFDIYVHLNCDPKVAWQRICDDEGKDRYEYPEYFEKQSPITKDLYDNIMSGKYKELDFLRTSKHLYVDTTDKTIQEVYENVYSSLKSLLKELK